MTVFINVVLAIFYSATQVLVYRWALTSWPENVEPAAAPLADAGEDRGSLRFDPRAITLAAAIAFAVLLSGTDWIMLASVSAFLAIAWAVSRPDPGGALARPRADRPARVQRADREPGRRPRHR